MNDNIVYFFFGPVHDKGLMTYLPSSLFDASGNINDNGAAVVGFLTLLLVMSIFRAGMLIYLNETRLPRLRKITAGVFMAQGAIISILAVFILPFGAILLGMLFISLLVKVIRMPAGPVDFKE